MTRALAIDLGTVRVGVAVSDPLGVIATPLETIQRRNDGFVRQRIAQLVAEREVEHIIIGLPRKLDGSDGDSARDARAFAAALKAELPIPVELLDERFTTVEAERSLIDQGVRRRERRESIDQVAATLLLRGWLQAEQILRERQG